MSAEAACVDDRLDVQRRMFRWKTIPTSKNDTPNTMSALSPLDFAARTYSKMGLNTRLGVVVICPDHKHCENSEQMVPFF